ncbi:hypothetical protein ACFLV7_16055 [Chloroflexota bacterium]
MCQMVADATQRPVIIGRSRQLHLIIRWYNGSH